MRYLSVCSGIEAASCAWHSLGWQPLAFSEIETFPRKVLAHHFPHVPLYGDFTALRDQPWIGAADLLVGGTPCQAFSVAGLRGSLSDERGNLTLEFVRLANAVDDLRRVDDPAWILWENVPGVLSTADNAFGAFVGGLAGCDAAVVNASAWPGAGVAAGPRRVVAWRILDAQYYGVAQRRRRVFVLARGRAAPCGGWSAADALLPLTDSGSRNPAPRREARKKVAGALASRTSGGGFPGTDEACVGYLQPVTHALKGEGHDASEDGTGRGVPIVIDALTASGRGVARVGESRGQDPVVPWEIAPAVTAKWAKGSAGPAGDECQNLVSFHPTSSMDGTTHALGCGSSGGQASVAVATLYAVRRLTPVECERLQGFPDGWTDIGPGTPDGPRYKALGNSMAVPVMAWIGRRIAEVSR